MSEECINCSDCGTDFKYTPTEQAYFVTNDISNAPRRCHNCRVLRRVKNGSGRSGTITALVCASCYCLTYVPFKPNGKQPVYCAACLHNPDLKLCV